MMRGVVAIGEYVILLMSARFTGARIILSSSRIMRTHAFGHSTFTDFELIHLLVIL
jgi:hypothetical protein